MADRLKYGGGLGGQGRKRCQKADRGEELLGIQGTLRLVRKGRRVGASARDETVARCQAGGGGLLMASR